LYRSVFSLAGDGRVRAIDAAFVLAARKRPRTRFQRTRSSGWLARAFVFEADNQSIHSSM